MPVSQARKLSICNESHWVPAYAGTTVKGQLASTSSFRRRPESSVFTIFC